MTYIPEEKYQDIVAERYTRGSPLIKLFSEQNKTETWRQLWINLAEAEMELGLKQINSEMIAELKAQKKNIDWEKIRSAEKRLKHDVMAHNHSYGEVCPKAAGIIHLGATSCYIQDNADLIIQKDALNYLIKKTSICLKRLGDFAEKYADFVTVGRTHYQTASFVTIGKRACIWAQELLMGMETLINFKNTMKFRGIKGATGTQDSFLTLFDNDEELVERLDELVTFKANFDIKFSITGQTYSRQQDSKLLFAISNLASVAKKIATDIRILQAFGEISEPFEQHQIGSSAMPYKQNPIRCERICGLARHLMCSVLDPLFTLSEQGLERTLDDSANRRIVINSAFLTLDAILTVLQNVFEGLVVHKSRILQQVNAELPFLALEKALMFLTESGVSRQLAHAKIRETALKGKKLLEEGENVSIELLLSDPFYDKIKSKIFQLCTNPLNFCGRCVTQTKSFLTKELQPKIKPYLQDFDNQLIILDV